MTDYDKTNTGALFKQDMQGNESWSDYQGSLNVEGKEYWLNAWIKTSKKGQKFMSVTVRAKDSQPKQPPKPQEKDDFVDNDEPF